MTDIKCDNADCRYCDVNEYICLAKAVQIDPCGSCITYEEYESKEPQEYYWKRFIDPESKTTFRKWAYGYKVVIGGVTFYADRDSRYKDEDRHVTENVSGVLCGSLADAKEGIEYVKKMIPIFGKVLDLPPEHEITLKENGNG